MAASSLTPMPTDSDAAAAIDFYARAFQATKRSRLQTTTGHVAQMSIDGLEFNVVDENPDAFKLSPECLGGTSACLSLIVDDADESLAQAIAAGGKEVSMLLTGLTGSGRAAWWTRRSSLANQERSPPGCPGASLHTLAPSLHTLAPRRPVPRRVHRVPATSW
jgi:uncharacterized glyoxalase superfamily protein PhnB